MHGGSFLRHDARRTDIMPEVLDNAPQVNVSLMLKSKGQLSGPSWHFLVSDCSALVLKTHDPLRKTYFKVFITCTSAAAAG